MLFQRDKLQEIVVALDSVIDRISEFEGQVSNPSSIRVHPNYAHSAKNLVHYLALRSFNINVFQDKLEDLGLPMNSGMSGQYFVWPSVQCQNRRQ